MKNTLEIGSLERGICPIDHSMIIQSFNLYTAP